MAAYTFALVLAGGDGADDDGDQNDTNDSDEGDSGDGDLIEETAENTEVPAIGTVATGTDSADFITGTVYADTLSGGTGDDTLVGGDGADRLNGNANDDYLSGGAGNDTLSGGASQDVLVGGSGNDLLNGDGGQDILFGGSGNDTLNGGDGIGLLIGGSGNDLSKGGTANDLIIDDTGSDTLIGGGGRDDLVSVDGDYDLDLVVGLLDNPNQFSAASNSPLDAASTGDGADVLDGGTQGDWLVFDGGDTVTGGAGTDVFATARQWANDLGPAVVTDYDPADDTLEYYYNASTGTPSLTVQTTDDGAAIVYDGDTAVLRIEDAPQGFSAGDITLIENDDTPTDSSTVLYENYFIGSGTNELITGYDTNDVILGDAGYDTIYGGNGHDYLLGAKGFDALYGEDGDDVLDGGNGQDALDGGDGDDLLNGTTLEVARGATGLADIANAPYFAPAADGSDTLYGGYGADTLIGAGADVLTGADGEDLLVTGDWDLDAGAVTVTDFDPTEDTLAYVYTGATPVLTSETDLDGTRIYADGTLIMTLTNTLPDGFDVTSAIVLQAAA